MDTTAAVLIIIGCVLLACIAILVCICACKRKSVVGDKNDKNLQKAKEHAESKKRFGQRGKHYEPGQVMSNQPTQGQQANAPDVVIVSTVPQYDWTFMKSPQTQFFEEQRRREEAAGAQPGFRIIAIFVRKTIETSKCDEISVCRHRNFVF
jgi:hypothetical protein